MIDSEIFILPLAQSARQTLENAISQVCLPPPKILSLAIYVKIWCTELASGSRA